MADLINIKEAEAEGANASPVAAVISYGKKFRVPHSVHSSNILRHWLPKDGVIVCEQVVSKEPLQAGQQFILVLSLAPLLGFYSAEPGLNDKPTLFPVYGAPVFMSAWQVAVGELRGQIATCDAFVYDSVAMLVSGTYAPTPEESN